jgi:hypothetical protein
VGGIWDLVPTGTAVPGVDYTAAALITEDGDFFYTVIEPQCCYTLYMGHLSSSGNTLSGTQYSGFVDRLCPTEFSCQDTQPAPLSGTINQRSTLTIATGGGDVSPSSVSFTYDSLYNQPSSLSLLQGQWWGGLSGSINSGAFLSIDASGAFSATLPGDLALLPTEDSQGTNCALTGQFSLIDPNYNAYDVTFYSSGTNCGIPAYGKGIATLDTQSAPTTLTIAVTYYDDTGNVQGVVLLTETPVQGGVWTAQLASGETALLLISPEPASGYFQTVSASCAELYAFYLVTGPGSTPGTYTLSPSYAFSNPSPIGPTSGCPPAGNDQITATSTSTPGGPFSLNITDSSNNMSSIDLTFASFYNEPASVATLAGTWASADGGSLSIQSDGSFAETNPGAPFSGCTVNGQIYLIDSTYNLYAYTMSWSSCPSGNDQSMREGLLTLNDAVTPHQLVGGGTVNVLEPGTSDNNEIVSFAATLQ